jgi:hypothetical protein
VKLPLFPFFFDCLILTELFPIVFSLIINRVIRLNFFQVRVRGPAESAAENHVLAVHMGVIIPALNDQHSIHLIEGTLMAALTFKGGQAAGERETRRTRPCAGGGALFVRCPFSHVSHFSTRPNQVKSEG